MDNELEEYIKRSIEEYKKWKSSQDKPTTAEYKSTEEFPKSFRDDNRNNRRDNNQQSSEGGEKWDDYTGDCDEWSLYDERDIQDVS